MGPPGGGEHSAMNAKQRPTVYAVTEHWLEDWFLGICDNLEISTQV